MISRFKEDTLYKPIEQYIGVSSHLNKTQGTEVHEPVFQYRIKVFIRNLIQRGHSAIYNVMGQ